MSKDNFNGWRLKRYTKNSGLSSLLKFALVYDDSPTHKKGNTEYLNDQDLKINLLSENELELCF